LPEEERPDTVLWRRPQFLIPAALLAAMALVAVVLPIWQERDYVVALAETTEQARVQANAADALRQQLDKATGDYNFALGKKYMYPSTVQLLDDVTKLLPDDTWLTQLDVKSMPKGKEPHREMMLRGESVNAGRLVSALEDSNLFVQAAPRSPTTKIQPGPGEVFDLGAQVKPLSLPEMVKLASVAPAVSAPRGGAGSALPPGPAAAAKPAAGTPAAETPSAETPGAAAAPAAAPGTAPPAAAPPPGTEPATAAPPPGGMLAPSARPPTTRPAVPAANGGRQSGPSRIGQPPGVVNVPAARAPGPAGPAAESAAPAPGEFAPPQGQTPPAPEAAPPQEQTAPVPEPAPEEATQ
jgi:hypothetical protein